MTWIDPDLTLTGRLVRLEPLSAGHLDGLVEAVRDGDLGERLWWTSTPSPERMAEDIASKLAARDAATMVPFACIRRRDGQPLGVTTYYDLTPDVPRLEIGYTWTRASAQGTGANADSKLLLIGHAMEQLGCQRVGLRTKWTNQQSRAAIERLGFRLDGVLRAYARHANGVLDDAVCYSLLAHEWPAAKLRLQDRVARHLG
ncbi:GNAT family N-acetyltransferase [Acidipropionibacterium virtanenii]|uniref:Ribosomal N-acetyltransferase YdaF n=1 Tax=Acidipropionibacterium virtanenii TaxID=2057246 RepID=A0A344USX2_9ACTN|nr:GNAT family N-acetyltransferase [Acidipropionibacterium virtanenii]AXE38370.1 Putative ribosomal N-acetyltransferase YdaF [Acidipropionibacterium virtanenii]